MAIYFYLAGEEWGFLSNFSAHGVEIDGLYYPTVEHFFQASKFLVSDKAHAEAIRCVKKAKDAATMGRDRKHPIHPKWEQIKEDVMRRGLLQKFRTHMALHEQLLATGDELLVEKSPIDYYWGCGQDGSGLNRLGVILMEVREQLRLEPAPVPKGPRPKRKK